MNSKTVKKEYEEELLLLQLSAISNVYEEEKRNKEELRKLEQEHQKEMSRLRGQKEEEEYQVRQFERKREEELRKHKMEMEEVERKNKREENELREKMGKLFEINLREAGKSHKEEASQLQKTLDQSLVVHDNLDKIEEVKRTKKIILETGSKWHGFKDSYELMKEVYFIEEQKESLDEETKKSLLIELNTVLTAKNQLDKHLMTARTSLGKWKSVADDKCYKDVDNGFVALSETLKKVETALRSLIKDVKFNKIIEQGVFTRIDSVTSECHSLVNELIQNPMAMKKSFQQMIEC